mmetsp:Transcript_102994/g.297838  ORF Transcript_102994/g.297838 Transcript_102994/m.297838 type:complete len:222 (+) Transcript_102994:145-810(+)
MSGRSMPSNKSLRSSVRTLAKSWKTRHAAMSATTGLWKNFSVANQLGNFFASPSNFSTAGSGPSARRTPGRPKLKNPDTSAHVLRKWPYNDCRFMGPPLVVARPVMSTFSSWWCVVRQMRPHRTSCPASAASPGTVAPASLAEEAPAAPVTAAMHASSRLSHERNSTKQGCRRKIWAKWRSIRKRSSSVRATGTFSDWPPESDPPASSSFIPMSSGPSLFG